MIIENDETPPPLLEGDLHYMAQGLAREASHRMRPHMQYGEAAQERHAGGRSQLRNEYTVPVAEAREASVQVVQSLGAFHLLQCDQLRTAAAGDADRPGQGGQLALIQSGRPARSAELGVFLSRLPVVEEILNIIGEDAKLPAAGEKEEKLEEEGGAQPLYDPSSSRRLMMRAISP